MRFSILVNFVTVVEDCQIKLQNCIIFAGRTHAISYSDHCSGPDICIYILATYEKKTE